MTSQVTSKKTATQLVHSDYVAPQNFGGLNTGIHHASTVVFPNVAALRARDWKREDSYTYGLHGTPTTFTLAHRIAEIEGGKHCVLAPSGLAAIMMINFAVLKTGDDVLLPDNVYHPSRELGDSLLKNFGISARYYDPMIGAGIAAMMQANTRLIWIEAPGSVTMEVPDIPALVAAAKAKNILTAIDNTWAAGLLFRPFDHGIDIAMHALTKYPSGGSDVLMGSVTTVDLDLHHRLMTAHMLLGLGVGGDDAYLVLRGLPTTELRVRQSGHSAMRLAQWLKARPEVSKILHPAFEDCPGHEHWQRDFTGACGLFSVLLRDDIAQERIDAMIDALELFKIGFSWGGVCSLVMPYQMAGGRTAKPWTHKGGLVRFYVGLEDIDDLIDDVAMAFGSLII